MQQFTKNVVLHPIDRRYQEFEVTVNVQNVVLTLKHKLQPNIAWIDEHTKNTTSVMNRGTAILNMLQQFLC